MQPITVVCPGSFDPIHRGHEQIIRRAAVLFERVIVGVGTNPSKSRWFTGEERLAMVEQCFADTPSVQVRGFEGLVTTFCAQVGAVAVVKGLRGPADLEYETPMAQMNGALTGVDTVYLNTAPEWGFVSSSLVKEVASLGGDVSGFLAPAVHEALIRRRDERTASA